MIQETSLHTNHVSNPKSYAGLIKRREPKSPLFGTDPLARFR
jgi:hypothetical protein